jgi:hypothetical protein
VSILLMLWIYEALRSDSLSWYDIPTKFHDHPFRHSSIIKDITSAILETTVLVLLIRGVYKMHRLDGLRWHYKHTKFHKDRFKRSKVALGENMYTYRLRTTHADSRSHKPTFFQNKESRPKKKVEVGRT